MTEGTRLLRRTSGALRDGHDGQGGSGGDNPSRGRYRSAMTTDKTRAPVPDNLSDPHGYQRHLVGLLGGDDPAAVQAASGDAWRALLAGSGPALRVRPAPAEWSAIECLGHAPDAEIVMSGRYRWALAEDRPELLGYDQDLWVAAIGHRDADPDALLGLFGALRDANIALWARTSAEGRARTALHRERGPESVDLMFRMIAGHDRFHLAQARRALEAAHRS